MAPHKSVAKTYEVNLNKLDKDRLKNIRQYVEKREKQMKKEIESVKKSNLPEWEKKKIIQAIKWGMFYLHQYGIKRLEII